MAVSLPDVIGEYVASSERYQTDGVQYAGYFEPAQIAPEEVANLFLFVQNTLNVPQTLVLKFALPTTKGLFNKQPMFQVAQPAVQVKLEAAEAGLLTLPVTTTGHVEAGEHEVTVLLQATAKSKGQRVRPAKSESKLSQSLIDSPVGLNLVSTLGASFVEKQVKKAGFLLTVEGDPRPPERAPRLQHEYEVLWQQKDMEVFNKAIQEINAREIKLKNELTLDALYVNLYAESVARFADSSLPLRIGEAIMLAKILTYSCQYFLSHPNRRNGLLVPIWERALTIDTDTTHTLDMIRSLGYYHLLKLAVMISFNLVSQAVGRHFWSLAERQAVAHHIAETLEAGNPVDVEFLYLPLLMGGTSIASKLKFEGEDPAHSLALMRKAREARLDLFTDPDMVQAGKVYDHILKKAL